MGLPCLDNAAFTDIRRTCAMSFSPPSLISAPFASCICPKTCNLQVSNWPIRADSTVQPAFLPRRVKSRTSCGGVCVSRISVSEGMRAYIS